MCNSKLRDSAWLVALVSPYTTPPELSANANARKSLTLKKMCVFEREVGGKMSMQQLGSLNVSGLETRGGQKGR